MRQCSEEHIDLPGATSRSRRPLKLDLEASERSEECYDTARSRTWGRHELIGLPRVGLDAPKSMSADTEEVSELTWARYATAADPRLRRAFELFLPFMTEPCRRMWRTLGPPPRSEEQSEVPPAHLMVRSEPSADHDLLSSFPSCRSQARDPSCGPFGTSAASVRPLGSEEPFGRSSCLPLSLAEPWVSRPALASLRKAWRGSFG